MQSLRDKLLKAGLVSEDAAKKAEAEKAARPARDPEARDARRDGPPRRDDRPRDERPPRRDDRPRDDRPPRRDDRPRGASFRPERAVGAPVPKLPPMAGSKEANRQAARKQLEADRAIRELVLAHTVPQQPGATAFYFVTRKNKLRRLELTPEQAQQLEKGELAVVERPDPDKIEHALVPTAIAEQLLAMSERAVRFLAREGAKVGFLSDDEIHRRASEADEPAPTAEAAPTTEAPAATDAAAEKPAEPDTFITVKRAPLP